MYNSTENPPRTSRRLTASRIACGLLVVALWFVAPVMGFRALLQGDQANSCHATQPVYDTLGLANVGNWTVTLAPGQSALLPDGDTATCRNGQLYVH